MQSYFNLANSRAAEIDEENEQAAAYQELITDSPGYLQSTMDALATEQQATTAELQDQVRPELYTWLAERHMALTDRLAELPTEQQESLVRVEEEKARIQNVADEAISKAMSREHYNSARLIDFIALVQHKKDELDQQREEVTREQREVEQELARLDSLFKVVGYPWPVPLINRYKDGGKPLGEMVDEYQSQLAAYNNGGIEADKVKPWEDKFTSEVEKAIADLAQQNLLSEAAIPYDVAIKTSLSSLIGTPTARDRLFGAGLISKQERRNELISGFELVCNCLYNTNRKYLGRGPYQKEAVAIVRKQLEEYLARQAESA